MGAAVIADSGVYSTLLSELADRRYLGTALTAQTAIGFLLTIVTIQLVPLLAAAAVGWRYAFLAFAAGPLTALTALTSLNRKIMPNEPGHRHHRKDNPLHYDPAAAKASRFGEIIVQGGITSAILNAVVAWRSWKPGPTSRSPSSAPP